MMSADIACYHTGDLITHCTELAYRALLAEVNLTPKPGLVDKSNNGAHKDMDLTDFYRSANAIRTWLPHFIEFGASSAELAPSQVLPGLRPLGIACENAMYRATYGVNTHKGSIFSLGLLCAAIGRLAQQERELTPQTICHTAAAFCHGLVARELQQTPSTSAFSTAGQRLFHRYGLRGARGEAEAGYPLVCNLALPHYRSRLQQGCQPELALLDTLLLLMQHNGDTNVAARGGMAGLRWLQRSAAAISARGGIRSVTDLPLVRYFDSQCITRNLSPGGSADLLIVTWFLAQLCPQHA